MKKVLSIFTAASLLFLIFGNMGRASAEPPSYENYIHIENRSGEAEVLNFKVVNGQITAKVTLKAGDYIQFLQPVSDLIDGDTDGLQINLGDHDFGGIGDINDYDWCGFSVQLTEDADPSVTATNASWPLKGGRAQEPYVFFKYIHTGATAITTDYCLFTTDNTVMPNRGVAFPFGFSTDESGKTLMTSKAEGENYYNTSNTTTDYAPAADTPVYVRVASNITHTYNIRLNSADITAPSHPGITEEGVFYIENASGTAEVLNSKLVNGQITVKVKLGDGDFIQFLQPLSDMINRSTDDGLQINLGDHQFGSPATHDVNDFPSTYANCDFDIQLTNDPDVTKNAPASWPMRGDDFHILTGAGTAFNQYSYYTSVAHSYWTAWTYFGEPNPGIVWQPVWFRNFALTPSFKTNSEGKLWMNPNDDTAYFTDYSGDGPISETTTNFVPENDQAYIRISSNKAETYSIRLNSADITADIKDEIDNWKFKDYSAFGDPENCNVEKGTLFADYYTRDVTVEKNFCASYMTKISDLDEASFRLGFNTGYQIGDFVTFGFSLDPIQPGASIDPQSERFKSLTLDMAHYGGMPAYALITLNSGEEFTRDEGGTPVNKTSTMGFLTINSIQAANGVVVSFVEMGGHWYLSVGGNVIKPSVAAINSQELDEYLRFDEYVENGAYFYLSNSKSVAQTFVAGIRSKDVAPDFTSGGDEDVTPDKMFLEKFLANLDGIRNRDIFVLNELKADWDALSYSEQLSVESELISDDELWALLEIIKAHQHSGGNDSLTDSYNPLTGERFSILTSLVLICLSTVGYFFTIKRHRQKRKAS